MDVLIATSHKQINSLKILPHQRECKPRTFCTQEYFILIYKCIGRNEYNIYILYNHK